MRRAAFVALAVLGVLGLVAGCGDDGSAEDATTTTTAGSGGSDGGEDTTTTTTEATGGSEGAEETTTSDAPGDGDVAAGGFTFDDCREIVEASAAISESLLSGDDPTESLQEAARAFEEFARKAPDEVRGDVETLAEVYGQLAEVSASGITAPSELGEAWERIESEPGTASRNLATWAAENCVPGD